MPSENDNIAAAREWANGYVEWLVPRLDDLLGPERWYAREHLQEVLGIKENSGIYTVPFPTSHTLRNLAETDKAAYSLASRIVERNRAAGADVPEPLLDIENGGLPKPRRRGKTGAENGVRDLILALMEKKLVEEFGLDTGRHNATRYRDEPTACEIIHDAFFSAGRRDIPDAGTIEKAIRRLTKQRE